MFFLHHKSKRILPVFSSILLLLNCRQLIFYVCFAFIKYSRSWNKDKKSSWFWGKLIDREWCRLPMTHYSMHYESNTSGKFTHITYFLECLPFPHAHMKGCWKMYEWLFIMINVHESSASLTDWQKFLLPTVNKFSSCRSLEKSLFRSVDTLKWEVWLFRKESNWKSFSTFCT
jgi:hypothetical protein